MFSRKNPQPPKKRNHDLSQFGLTEIPDDFDPSAGFGGGEDDDADDSDLEAELAAIAGGGPPKPKAKPKPKAVAASELERMVAASMRDVGSDDEDDDDADENDLLGELHDIAGGEMTMDDTETQPSVVASPPAVAEPQQLFLPTTTLDTAGVIRQRIEMYKQAEANAKSAGEGAKARRYGRGLNTLNDLLRQASAGKAVNVDDIPPEVSVKIASAPPAGGADGTVSPSTAEEVPKVPSRSAPPPPTPKSTTTPSPTEPVSSSVSTPPTESSGLQSPPAATNPLIDQMRSRQRDYKAAALQAKRKGDTATALQFLKVVKQFDLVVKMCEDGQEVDLSDMPPPPEQFLEFLAQMQAGPTTSQPEAPPPPAPVAEPEPAAAAEAPPTPANMAEALQQRLDKYQSVADAAKAEGNSSKARRFGRIVKQYEDAIRAYKAGRSVEYDELPIPPGFGPLPVGGGAAAAPPPAKPSPTSPPSKTPSATSSGSGTETTTPIGTPTPAPRKAVSSPSPSQKHALTTRITGNQQKNNLAEEQMRILLERQKEFKVAALQAKKAGEIEQAKEYLKIYKGFDSVLNAASSGLPVDMATLPLPPSQRENLEASFAIVSTEECDPEDGDIADIAVRIEEQLVKQLMMCKNTRDHHKAMGDIGGMNRFENLAITVQKDLDLVRYSKRKEYSLPKFHYENRSFNIVHCNTDLNDSELEIVVVRGINYKVANPKDVDTYVKVEFPLLNDETFKAKTNVVRDTDSPEYEQHFMVEIQRNNRQVQRIFKRHGVKFEVYSRGGFLRSDTLIGTVTVKLQPLETKCDIHDTFDVMEGRRAVGGKLEVKVRIRNPILTKQMEHINEKWLVLDT